MAKRDRAACQRAVAAAWKRERQLVLEGKGTRDWTEEQQLDIIELGKAFDADGIAFEGQHMKSAEAYPDFQGEPDNIQLLSKSEHLEAHKGDFRNPTNWYFNPTTLEYFDFGAGAPIPCEVIDLDDPIAIGSNNETKRQQEDNETNNMVQKSVSSDELKKESKGQIEPVQAHELPRKQKRGFWENVKYYGGKVVDYAVNHPVETVQAILLGAETVKVIKNHTASRSKGDLQMRSPSQMPTNQQRNTHNIGKTAIDIIYESESIISQPIVTSDSRRQMVDTGIQAIKDLNDYSMLLKMGYNTSVSEEARHKILEDAVGTYGDQPIKKLLQFLINTSTG